MALKQGMDYMRHGRHFESSDPTRSRRKKVSAASRADDQHATQTFFDDRLATM